MGCSRRLPTRPSLTFDVEGVRLGHGAQDPVDRRDISPGPLPRERPVAPAEAMDVEVGFRGAADRVEVAGFEGGGEVGGHR